MNWNIAQIKNELKNIADELQEMKRLFRESGQPRVNLALYRSREKLRARATMLCSIRAHGRGKLHLSKRFTALSAQWEFIAAHTKPFLQEEAA